MSPLSAVAREELQRDIAGEVRFDPVARSLYRNDASIYEIEPEGVVLPRTLADVLRIVELARKHRLPILPRGGGTSLAGQSVGRALHLDFSKYMNRILELNVVEKWVRVQPGVTLDELNAEMKPHGLLFGPDVATSSRANIGGMIGNNSCGVHSLIYGKTIDHVLELKTVLADGSEVWMGPVDQTEYRRRSVSDGLEGQIYREIGSLTVDNAAEIRRRFPTVMRRVSGYNLDAFVDETAPFDLSKIVVGSEGTLCIVVEAKLRLVDLPVCTGLVACHFADLVESMRANVVALETRPSAVELTDKKLLEQTRGSIEHAKRRHFIEGDPQAILFVEYYAGNMGQLVEKMDLLEARLRESGLGYAYVRAVGPTEQKNMVELRKAGLGLLMGMTGDAKPTSGVEDTCVPVVHLPEYVARLEELMMTNGVDAVYYAHCSVGVLHVRPILDLKKPGGIETLRRLQETISDMVLEYGGAMSAEHGDGLARSEWIRKMFGSQIVAAFERVKDSFDPEGLMNPGKIVRAPRMDQNLRFDAAYVTRDVSTYFDFTPEGGFQQAVEMCSGVGQCRKKLVGTMCPSYMATLDEQHSTRGRANALRAALSGRLITEGLHSHELFEVMDLCLECKACKAECPSNVDMAKLKYEFLAHYYGNHGYPLRAHLFGKIHRLSRWASALAPLSNWILGSRLNRWFLDRFLGIDRRRQLPQFASRRFSRWFEARPESPEGRYGTVVLFNDTFVEFNEPHIGIAATHILERAGYSVVLNEAGECCGRPLISKGFLPQAKELARRNVIALASYADLGWPLVGIEPSCILSLRDDYLDLVSDPRASAVAANSYMLEEFLVEQLSKRDLGLVFSGAPRKILVHGHCHQKALVGTEATIRVLEMVPNFEVKEIPSGCCGMAGSFGYEKEHYEVSMDVGAGRLFSAIEEAGPEWEVAAVGTSCRHQITDATGRKARHWVEILAEAL